MIHPDLMHKDPSQKEMQKWLSDFPTLEEKMNKLAALNVVPEANIAVTLSLALERFNESGRVVYSMGRNLYSNLKDIKLKVYQDEIWLPFRSFFLDFSEAHPDIWIWGGDRTEWHRLGGAYLYTLPPGLVQGEDGSVYEEESLGIIFWGKANKKSVDISDDAVYHFMMPLSKLSSPTVGEYLKDRFVRGGEEPAADPLKSKDKASNDRRANEILKAFHLVLNTLLYITSDSPDIGLDSRTFKRQDLESKLFRAGPSKRAKLKRQMEKTTTCYIQQLAPSLEQALEPEESLAGVARHKVSAHFNRYWVGPKHPKYSESKVKHPKEDKRLVKIFVEGYERGQDIAGRVVSRTYKMK